MKKLGGVKMVDEKIKLLRTLASFKEAMSNKLEKQILKGYNNWDNKDLISDNELLSRLEDKLTSRSRKDLDAEDFIDVANYCMFLWYRLKED